MALALTIKVGQTFSIGAQDYELLRSLPPNDFTDWGHVVIRRRSDGQEFVITEEAPLAVDPDVRIQVADAGMFHSRAARLAISAPRKLRIKRP